MFDRHLKLLHPYGCEWSEAISSSYWGIAFRRLATTYYIVYGILVFVGQGVYVGAMGRDCVGLAVIVGRGVFVGSNGVAVSIGVRETVGVKVTFVLCLSRLKARTEAARSTKITPATPPRIHGSKSALFLFFFTTSLKSAGTAIKTTVVLSCPP